LSRRLKSKVSVFTGNSVYFRYWNTDKNFGKYPFTKPTETVDMTMKEFIENLKRASEEGIKNPDGL
jgi:serine/threonine-protein kinase RIO1